MMTMFLPFRIDYINTMKTKEIPDKKIQAIDTKKALQDPQRIHDVVAYMLEHFDQKTRRNAYGRSYQLLCLTNVQDVAKNNKTVEEKQKRRLQGFNSIFAVDSIPLLMKYYTELKNQIQKKGLDLTIATIYSFNPNEEDPDESLRMKILMQKI